MKKGNNGGNVLRLRTDVPRFTRALPYGNSTEAS